MNQPAPKVAVDEASKNDEVNLKVTQANIIYDQS